MHYHNSLVAQYQSQHKSPADYPLTASLRILHTLHSRHAGTAHHEVNGSIGFTSTSSERLHTAMNLSSLLAHRQPQHSYPHGVERPCGPMPLTHRAHSLSGVPAPEDAVVCLILSPWCRGTGCSPIPTAGGGSSNKSWADALHIHYEMWEIGYGVRITNMSDRVFI